MCGPFDLAADALQGLKQGRRLHGRDLTPSGASLRSHSACRLVHSSVSR